MYKVKNPYKDSHIMDLNMMHIGQYKRTRIAPSAILFSISPLIAIGALVLATFVPDMQFFAECQNIPGGDVCSLSFK